METVLPGWAVRRPMEPTPAFSTTAAVSERVISPSTLSGKRAVLVLHGPKTQEAPKLVGKAVRAAFPSADDVVVANVVNLHSMAGMWAKVANAQIKQTYEKLAAKFTEGDPADYVMICPDYENSVAPAFGFANTDKQAAVVVLAADGQLIGKSDAGDLGEQAIAWLSA